jgi:hypothetical protein
MSARVEGGAHGAERGRIGVERGRREPQGPHDVERCGRGIRVEGQKPF